MTTDDSPHDPVTSELLEWIRASTQRLRDSTEGLDEQQVRDVVAPSGWTIAGLIGHVRDSTWFWLHHVAAGRPMDFDENDTWDNDPDTSFTALLDTFEQDTAQACSEVAPLFGDAPPGWWPDGAWGGYRLGTVREVLIHLLNDNAAHTGHLDIARERIDGGVWDSGRNRIRV